MAHKKNAAKLRTRQSQMPFISPRFAHVSVGSTDQIRAFLTATPLHSKIAVTISRNCNIAFSNRNNNIGVAVRKTKVKILVPGAIFAADLVRDARHSSRTAGF
jgi:hypothetical protein